MTALHPALPPCFSTKKCSRGHPVSAQFSGQPVISQSLCSTPSARKASAFWFESSAGGGPAVCRPAPALPAAPSRQALLGFPWAWRQPPLGQGCTETFFRALSFRFCSMYGHVLGTGELEALLAPYCTGLLPSAPSQVNSLWCHVLFPWPALR